MSVFHVTWNGKTVRTAIWKSPVEGRRMMPKLDIDDDAQADFASHGEEQRAVFVCQMDAYHYWERFLGPSVADRIANAIVDPTFSFMTVDHDGKICMDCSSPYAMARLVGLKD
jgi:hypothetical protein